MSKEEQKDAAEGFYEAPAVARPSLSKMRKIADQVGLDLSDDELKEMTGPLGRFFKSYDVVYRMVEPKPPVKYPRTPGYRPPPEENKYNAWYMKTDIQGAKSGKLYGKTVAIKDSICVAGVPMMNGSKIVEGYIPEFDATVVTRTLDAGGHIVGKAACENFCMSGNSFTNDLGCVFNPHDTSRTCGGSSGGSAVLLAAKEVDLAIGGDQGGSIRIPSSWCGTVGLKPTFGLVPYTGGIMMEPTIDHLGPMARTVEDCALLLEVLAGPDGYDFRQKEEMTIPEYSKQLKSDLTGVKVGLVKEGFENCTEEVSSTVKAATQHLVKAGATVTDINVPLHTHGEAIWLPVCMEGAYATMIDRAGAAPGAKGFHNVTLMDHQFRALKMNPNNLSGPMKLLTMFAEYIESENNYHFYGRGCNLVMSLTEAYDKALNDVDVLLMPTLPYTAPKLPNKSLNIAAAAGEAFGMVCNTAPFNATGYPALSINARTSKGLPVGMMIIGKKCRNRKYSMLLMDLSVREMENKMIVESLGTLPHSLSAGFSL